MCQARAVTELRRDLLDDVRSPVLHQAAKTGNASLVQLFMKYGASIDHQDPQGRTALHLAMGGGHERTAWALICKGAKVDVLDQEGLTPLMHGLLAARAAMDSEAPVRAVSVLAQCSEPGSLEAQLKRLEEVVRLKQTKRSELITAAQDGQVEDVKKWLGKLADPNIKDPITGMDPLRAALVGGGMDSSAHDQVPCIGMKLKSHV